MEIKVVI